IRLERGHDHVIGRDEEEDREDHQEDIGQDQRPAAVAAEARAAARQRPGDGGNGSCGHPTSLPRLRTSRRMKMAAMARIGNMNSDTEAPSGMSPERMPSRKA